MAAPFTDQNYQDIISILGLDPSYIRSGSTLRYQGGNLEDLDAEQGTDFVSEVQQAITDYQTAQSARDAAIASDDAIGVQSQSVPGEYSLSWGNRGAIARYDRYQIAMRNAQQTIIRLLRWKETNRYSGRATKTIS